MAGKFTLAKSKDMSKLNFWTKITQVLVIFVVVFSPFSSFNSLTEDSSMTETTGDQNEADVEVSENEDVEVFEDDFQQRVVSVAPKTKSQLKRPTYLNSNTSSRLLAARQRMPRSKSISAYGVKDPEPKSDPSAVSDGGGVSPKVNIPKIEDKKV